MKYSHIFRLIFVLLCSCNVDTGERKTNTFEIKESIHSNKISIKEVFQPIDMIILDDYIIFQNEYMDKDDCFFVYSLDKYEFLYSFGEKGSGPEEFISPRFVDNSSRNTLSIIDSGNFILRSYDINSKSSTLKHEIKISELRSPIQDMSFVNDSISLILYYTNEDVFLYSYNYVKNTIIDTLNFDTGLREIMGENFSSAINDFNFCNLGNKFIVNFLFLNKIISGELDDLGRFTNKDYPQIKADFIPAKSLYDNINYYHYPQMSNSYIYAQYYGYIYRNLAPLPFNLKGRNYNYTIEVYNTDLEPIALLSLDNESYRFYINKEDGKIYYWNPLTDFDYLFVFDIPDLPSTWNQ